MYSNRVGLIRSRENVSQQVVVKIKATQPVRRAMRIAAADGIEPSRPGSLGKWLASSKVKEMEPVFGDAPRRGLANFRRMAIAAEHLLDRELAGINVLSLQSSRDAKKACEEIGKDPMVEYAYIPPEKYTLAKRRTSSNDALLNRQWGLTAIKLFAAERAAGFKAAKDIVIAVIDSGIDSNHPDLNGILTEEINFTAGAKKDTSGHGTHVAGIIAAVRNNSIGVRGVTNSTKILSLKALDPYSATGYYRAIRHATDHAQVINFSLGGPHDPTEETLIRRAIRKGVIVVAAMGNEKLEGNPKSYPAAIAKVIAVGASDETDKIAPFSCTGTHIDLIAPGVSILSTVPTYPSSLATGTDYEAWPGTSMAAPMVSAASALCLAKKPATTVAKVRKALVDGADEVPTQSGFDATHGHGRLNVLETLKII